MQQNNESSIKQQEVNRNDNLDTSKTLGEQHIKLIEPHLFKFENIEIDSFKLLRLLMYIKQISYGDLSRKICFSRSYIYEILHGKKDPPHKTKEKIAEFFGLPVEFIWQFK